MMPLPAATEYRGMSPDGYVQRRAPGHPNANKTGILREHVLVAAAAIGRGLPRGAEVHHLNEIKADNRPENLVICQDRTFHQLLHKRARALRASGHPDWSRCKFCLLYGPPETMTHVAGAYSAHRECMRIRSAKWRMKQSNPGPTVPEKECQ